MSSIGGIAVFLILLYLGMLYQSTGIALVGFFLSTLLVLSFVWQMLWRKNFYVSLNIPISLLDQNYPVHIYVQTDNDTYFKLRKAQFCVEYENTMEKEKHQVWLDANNIPMDVEQYRYELRIAKAGNYEFRLKYVRIYDFFGLFYWRYTCRSHSNVMVLPNMREIPISLGERVKQFFGDSDVYDQERPGHDPSEIFDIREFRDGDRVPNIHWKLSAKMDQMMVRENSLPKACPILLCLNGTGGSGEQPLEDLASISFSLVDQKCPHYLIWLQKSGDVSRIRVEDEESFYEGIMELLQDINTKEVENILEQYKEKYKGEQYVHSIVMEKNNLVLDGSAQTFEGEITLLLT